MNDDDDFCDWYCALQECAGMSVGEDWALDRYEGGQSYEEAAYWYSQAYGGR